MTHRSFISSGVRQKDGGTVAEIVNVNVNVEKCELNIKGEDCKLLSHDRATSLSRGEMGRQ